MAKHDTESHGIFGNGTWQRSHAAVGAVFSLRARPRLQSVEQLGHNVWDAWRKLWTEFSRSRRDAQAVQHVQYSPARTKSARMAFLEQGAHGRAVLTGAAVSDARFDRMKQRAVAACTWCQEIPTWNHVS